MISKKALNTLLVSAVAVSVAGAASTANAQNGTEKEKCYGVVKAGKNDCAAASGSHSCHAAAPADGLGDEWIAVPKGLCERLANGSLTPVSVNGAQPVAPEAPGNAASPAQTPPAAPVQ
jgi:uncharacterized membrane protein